MVPYLGRFKFIAPVSIPQVYHVGFKEYLCCLSYYSIALCSTLFCTKCAMKIITLLLVVHCICLMFIRVTYLMTWDYLLTSLNKTSNALFYNIAEIWINYKQHSNHLFDDFVFILVLKIVHTTKARFTRSE